MGGGSFVSYRAYGVFNWGPGKRRRGERDGLGEVRPSGARDGVDRVGRRCDVGHRLFFTDRVVGGLVGVSAQGMGADGLSWGRPGAASWGVAGYGCHMMGGTTY